MPWRIAVQHIKINTLQDLQGAIMAILLLHQERKKVNEELFYAEYAKIHEDIDFINFRRTYYELQYEFGLRAKEIDKDVINAYRGLAGDELTDEFYGASDDRFAFHPVQYDATLFIDLKLSKHKAKELFDETAKKLWQQIESMYDDYRIEDKFYITDYFKNSNNKKKVGVLFKLMKDALIVFDIFEKQKQENNVNKAEIGRIMGWAKSHEKQREGQRDRGGDKVRVYLNYANIFIEAASKGELYNEVCKALKDKTLTK